MEGGRTTTDGTSNGMFRNKIVRIVYIWQVLLEMYMIGQTKMDVYIVTSIIKSYTTLVFYLYYVTWDAKPSVGCDV